MKLLTILLLFIPFSLVHAQDTRHYQDDHIEFDYPAKWNVFLDANIYVIENEDMSIRIAPESVPEDVPEEFQLGYLAGQFETALLFSGGELPQRVIEDDTLHYLGDERDLSFSSLGAGWVGLLSVPSGSLDEWEAEAQHIYASIEYPS